MLPSPHTLAITCNRSCACWPVLPGGTQNKTPVLSLFILLEVMATVLISLQGLSFFVLWRAVLLSTALWLRTAVFKFQVRMGTVGVCMRHGCLGGLM